TAAERAFDVASARQKLDAAADWAATQRDAQGRILPAAQYSVAVHSAAFTWQVAAGPALQSYHEAVAEQTHRLTVAAAEASLAAGLERVAADEAYLTAVAAAEQ